MFFQILLLVNETMTNAKPIECYQPQRDLQCCIWKVEIPDSQTECYAHACRDPKTTDWEVEDLMCKQR